MLTTHAGALMPHVPAGGANEIAWYDPIGDRVTGTLAHANNGVGDCASAAPSPVIELFAGVVGWTNESVVWSISWTAPEDASPVISDFAAGWVKISWVNLDGAPAPITGASIGSLTLTATINGTPIAVGQRLTAVTTSPGGFPQITWGPE